MIEVGTKLNTLTGCFSEQVRKTPDALALIDEHRQLSYTELDQLSDALARSLPSHEGFVGLVMDHGVEMIIALWAILKSGAAYVPVEPNFPQKRIRYMMQQSKASFVITQLHYEHLFDFCPCIFVEQGFSLGEVAPAAATQLPSVQADSLAYVLYTSGTTGQPKGVAVEHHNVCHYVRAYAHEFHPSPQDTMLQNSVCSFDIFVEEVFTPLLSGGTLAIPEALTRTDTSLLMQFVHEKQVSIISGFPYLMWDINKLENLPPSVRLLISGGDVLKAHYVNNLLDKAEVYNTYGPTETTVCATYFKCNGYKALDDNTYPIGRAILETSIFLCDKNLEPVAPGEPGEICISGLGVSRGYLDENTEAFVRLNDGMRMYRSGDMGCMLPDGNLLFLMRKDDQVMILGKRVEPKEVESVLEHYPHIEHAVVIPHLDEEGLNYLTAYLVVSFEHQATQVLKTSELNVYLTQHLPDYMIPEFFIQLNDLPLTPNGKVDKNALPLVLKKRQGL